MWPKKYFKTLSSTNHLFYFSLPTTSFISPSLPVPILNPKSGKKKKNKSDRKSEWER